MKAFRLEPTAKDSLDDINDYTASCWGEEQAEAYLSELFKEFERIAARHVPWRPLPAGFGIDGFSRRARKHVIYWFEREGIVHIFAILHERMDQAARAQVALNATGES